MPLPDSRNDHLAETRQWAYSQFPIPVYPRAGKEYCETGDHEHRWDCKADPTPNIVLQPNYHCALQQGAGADQEVSPVEGALLH